MPETEAQSPEREYPLVEAQAGVVSALQHRVLEETPNGKPEAIKDLSISLGIALDKLELLCLSTFEFDEEPDVTDCRWEPRGASIEASTDDTERIDQAIRDDKENLQEEPPDPL